MKIIMVTNSSDVSFFKISKFHSDDYPNGAFTLTVTETETDSKYTELSENLCCYVSVQYDTIP